MHLLVCFKFKYLTSWQCQKISSLTKESSDKTVAMFFFVSESKVGFKNKLEKWLSRSLSLNGHKFEAEARQPSYRPRQTFRIKKCRLQFNEEGSFC